jgi:hypothetical protein
VGSAEFRTIPVTKTIFVAEASKILLLLPRKQHARDTKAQQAGKRKQQASDLIFFSIYFVSFETSSDMKGMRLHSLTSTLLVSVCFRFVFASFSLCFRFVFSSFSLRIIGRASVVIIIIIIMRIL